MVYTMNDISTNLRLKNIAIKRKNLVGKLRKAVWLLAFISGFPPIVQWMI